MNFEELKISRQYIRAIEEAGYTEPTPIQVKAIPSIRSGQDLIGIAQTGTGKTAAYLLPLLQVLSHAKDLEPRCLVLVPTKELVLQVRDSALQLAQYTDLRILGIYGGVGAKAQIESIEKGCDMLIATPGRFKELYTKGAIFTRKIKHVVLDEADRMMDMGFMHQIRSLQEVLPSKRQNLLFSATFPQKVERLAEEFMDFPIRIEVSPQATPVETVEQQLYLVPNFKTKLNLLMHLLADKEKFNKVIIFTRTKEYAENVGKYLDRKEVGEVRSIHSNKAQNSRINAVNEFRNGGLRILVCTDIAARGLDIPEVSHVINLSIPREHLDYVHRIGRTGRALKTGTAISFCDPSEVWHVRQIEDIIQMSIPEIPLPDIEKAETLREEKQEMARELDTQRRKDDPEFKGAFHERIPKSQKIKKKESKPGFRRK
jgi:ATP-dependent RNA helicase RhlE